MAEGGRILITGGTGQLGRELALVTWPDGLMIDAPGREVLDLGDPERVRSAFAKSAYAAVINAGAWTAVDAAETEVEATFRINALAPALLAELTSAANIPLVHVSTDYVFDGAASAPYAVDHALGPINAYGASKAAGELAVASGNRRSAIIRTSWVVSPRGRNFVRAMLNLAQTRDTINVVADQRGAPTSARDLAQALARVASALISDPQAPTGIFHFTNAGEASWADVAAYVFALSRARGGPAALVRSITTAEYPTPAERPAYSVLSNDRIIRDYGLAARPWTEAVAEIVEVMVEGGMA